MTCSLSSAPPQTGVIIQKKVFQGMLSIFDFFAGDMSPKKLSFFTPSLGLTVYLCVRLSVWYERKAAFSRVYIIYAYVGTLPGCTKPNH